MLSNVDKLKEIEKEKENIRQVKKNQQFKIIRQQVQVKKQKRVREKEDYIREGFEIKEQAQEELYKQMIREQEQIEKKKLLVKEIKIKNDENLEFKQRELEKEIEEQKKREKYFKQKEQKKREWSKQLEIKVQKLREIKQELIDKRSKELFELNIMQQELLDQNILKYKEKVDKDLRIREAKRNKLKEQIQLQRQYNIKHKNDVALEEKEYKDKFSKFWRERNKKIADREKGFEEKRAEMKKFYADENKKLSKEKLRKKEREILEEYLQAAQIQNKRTLDDRKFKSYAEQCLEEWKDNGKNVTPMLIELQKYKDSLMT